MTSNAWEGVPLSVLASIEREVMGCEIPGIDHPMPNGCWRCIGCGKFISARLRWNQCGDCDTREPQEM